MKCERNKAIKLCDTDFKPHRHLLQVPPPSETLLEKRSTGDWERQQFYTIYFLNRNGAGQGMHVF